MTLGEKLLQARQTAGLSQRQAAEGIVTRNMLSQIEHGTANPSMETLKALAKRLDTPLGYFLEEDGAVSPNQAVMDRARHALDTGAWAAGLEALAEYRFPDALFDRERQLLTVLLQLGQAEEALGQGKYLYARELLLRAEPPAACYCASLLERRRGLLLARLPGSEGRIAARQLPSLDEELLLRADAALEEGESRRAACLLDAAQNREIPRWQLLRGRACLEEGEYDAAVQLLLQVEERFPQETAPMLEHCFRELGDYRKAYFYACRQREPKA